MDTTELLTAVNITRALFKMNKTISSAKAFLKAVRNYITANNIGIFLIGTYSKDEIEIKIGKVELTPRFLEEVAKLGYSAKEMKLKDNWFSFTF